MNAVLVELRRRSPWLFNLALLHLGLLLVLLLLMAVDQRQLTGVNIWLKPAKFALSISVYLLTMAWLLGELQRPRWLIAAVVAVVIAAMSLEQLLITMQAVRGTTSHYNIATPFDSAVFSMMGFGVAANSLAAAVALGLFLVHRAGDRPGYWWGIRTGLAIFLLGSVQGFAMIANAAHTVGAADGGPGIPLLAWSTQAGDLRIAHFVGIHALQVLPLVGWLIDRRLASRSWRIALVLLVALAYVGLGLLLYWQALAGQSIFARMPFVGTS